MCLIPDAQAEDHDNSPYSEASMLEMFLLALEYHHEYKETGEVSDEHVTVTEEDGKLTFTKVCPPD